MFVYIIAVAAGIGSLVGAFFQVRVTALLWSTPLLCFIYGVSVFLSPHVQANEDAPEVLRAVMIQLTDLSLFVPMLIAGAAGTLLASSMTRYVQTEHSHVLRPQERINAGRIERVASGSARERLKDRTDQLSKDRVDLARRATARQPVYEVSFDPPAPPEPAAAADEAAPPPPRPAPPASVDPAANRRRQGRRRSALAGELVFDDGVFTRCTIQDLSVGGARVRLMGPWPEARALALHDLTNGIGHDVVLSWRAGPIAGLRFTTSYQLDPG